MYISAVNQILDSLDDIHCLQDPLPQDADLIQSILEDRQLHALLEVSTIYYYNLMIKLLSLIIISLLESFVLYLLATVSYVVATTDIFCS